MRPGWSGNCRASGLWPGGIRQGIWRGRFWRLPPRTTREAQERGVLFNRSDCPEACGFFFPAICEGGGLTAGVVGDGSDHRRTAAAAKRIRETLEVL